MRLRRSRRIRKQLRTLPRWQADLARTIEQKERGGLSLVNALRQVVLDPGVHQTSRGLAGRLLLPDHDVLPELLDLFALQAEQKELYLTALAIEEFSDPRAIAPLIQFLLNDPNPHRRRAAARALGWIRPPTRAAAHALAQCLGDPQQPQPAREEAAESLAYTGTRETMPVLIQALRDPDVRIRFWSVFGLGTSRLGRHARGPIDPLAVAALESVLEDKAVPPGNWWSVGKEALAMLGSARAPIGDYPSRLAAETKRVMEDPDASAEDRRWAECYE